MKFNFQIHFEDRQFADLRKRVNDTATPQGPASPDWALGTPAGALRELLDYWTGDGGSRTIRKIALRIYRKILSP